MNRLLASVLALCLSFFASSALAGEWFADSQTGCKGWNKFPEPDETISWSGACVDGKASGAGTLQFFQSKKPGGRYEGTYVEGKTHGYAEYFNKTGDISKRGLWLANELVLPCTTNSQCAELKASATKPLADCKVSDGDINREYRGECRNGLAHGKGWASGRDIFIGEFKDGKKHGSGIYLWGMGDRYEGTMVDDQRQGYGEYTTAKSGELRRGVWNAGKLERPCTANSQCTEMKADAASPIVNCKVNDPDIAREYRGECRNGLAHGKGRAKGRDVYVGEFKDGNTHGQGLYTWASGGSYDGTWVEGTRTQGKYKDSDGSYEGDFKDREWHGFGVRQYSCNCSTGFLFMTSCDTCTDRGWWQNSKLVRSCDSRSTCEKLNRLEPLVRRAESELRCEDAKKINQELEAVNAGVFSFDACVSERRFANLAKSSDPQEMYLAGGRYEADGERSRAKTIYRKIVDRFPKHALAIKATDRLTRLSDVEAVESSNRSAAYQVESSNNQSREASYQQCMNDYSACTNSCDRLKDSSARYSCKSGCALCSK